MESFGKSPQKGHDWRDAVTWFLVALPTFSLGFASVLSLWGGQHQYNISRNGQEADARAIYSDWQIIGQDLRAGIAQRP